MQRAIKGHKFKDNRMPGLKDEVETEMALLYDLREPRFIGMAFNSTCIAIDHEKAAFVIYNLA